MAQVLPRNCPRCGTPTVADQRFCANCGLSAEAMQARGGYVMPVQNPQNNPVQPQQLGPQSFQGFQQQTMQPPFQDHQQQNPVLPPFVISKRLSSMRSRHRQRLHGTFPKSKCEGEGRAELAFCSSSWY